MLLQWNNHHSGTMSQHGLFSVFLRSLGCSLHRLLPQTFPKYPTNPPRVIHESIQDSRQDQETRYPSFPSIFKQRVIKQSLAQHHSPVTQPSSHIPRPNFLNMATPDECRPSILGRLCNHTAFSITMSCQIIIVLLVSLTPFYEYVGLEETRTNADTFWAIVVAIDLAYLCLCLLTDPAEGSSPDEDTWDGGFWHREVDEVDLEKACGTACTGMNGKH